MKEPGEARDSGLLRERIARPLAERLGREYQRVALIDAGFLPHAGGFEPFDLGGITEPVIARLEGGHLRKRVRGHHLREREVDAIIFHSVREPRADEQGRLTHLWGHAVEQRLARDAWVRTHFRVTEILRYRPGYYYVVLARQPAPDD